MRELILSSSYERVIALVNEYPKLATKEHFLLALYRQDCRIIAYLYRRCLTMPNFDFLLVPDRYPDARQKIVALLYDMEVDFSTLNFSLLEAEFVLKLVLQLHLCRAVKDNDLPRAKILLRLGARYPCASSSPEMFVLLQMS